MDLVPYCSTITGEFMGGGERCHSLTALAYLLMKYGMYTDVTEYMRLIRDPVPLHSCMTCLFVAAGYQDCQHGPSA